MCTQLFNLTNISPKKPKMGKPKPKLTLDISQINSAPPNESPRPTRPDGRTHTHYVNLVGLLRNPAAAAPITKWMETGRVVGRPLGSSMPKWKPKPKPKTPVQEYMNYFDEDPSGSLIPFFKKLKPRVYKKSPKSEESLSGSLATSVSRPVYNGKEMAKKVPKTAKKVQENIAPSETPKPRVYKKLPKSEESSSGSLSESVSGPAYDVEEMAKKILEHIASSEKLKVGAYKKSKKPPKSDESSSKE
jgi:hypothetical protein